MENSESANSGTPQIHYKRIEIAINSSDSAEKVRGDLIDGKYDEHIAACILLQQEQINKKRLLVVANVVHRIKIGDVNPVYLRALIIVPEGDDSLKEALGIYLKKAEGRKFIFVDKKYGNAPSVFLETNEISKMTWRETKILFEEFIESYSASQLQKNLVL